jgi:hypothetical protein
MSNLTTLNNKHFIEYLYPKVFKITENNLFISDRHDTMSINVIHHENQTVDNHRETNLKINAQFLTLSTKAKELMQHRSTLRTESHNLHYESPMKLRIYDRCQRELHPRQFINIPLLTKVTARICESYSRDETQLHLTALYLH